jgi:acetyl esterase
VDYALSPEHRFPVAVEEGHAVLEWLQDAGLSVAIDGEQLGVFGDSAGGNLAAAVALLARHRGAPTVRFQLLVYPVTDHGCDTASYAQFSDGYFLTRATMAWCWEQYLDDPKDGDSPYASPLRAEFLAGLPPAYIVTAECDPIRDEAEAYARRLEEAGVDVTLIRYPGQIHGFFTMPGVIDAAGRAIDEAASAVRKAFAASLSQGPSTEGEMYGTTRNNRQDA